MIALAFDAYGTLFDVRSIEKECEHLLPEAGSRICALWREKQLQYSWLSALTGRYESFWALTERSLDYALATSRRTLTESQRAHLLEAYLHLTPYPDVSGALTRLGDAGLRLSVLSNGSPDMLLPVIENAGFGHLFEAVLSVDDVQTFKPSPKVYAMATSHFDCNPGDVGFVTSNAWDALGAKAFGFHVFWVNRAASPVESLGEPPDLTVANLHGVADRLAPA